MTYTICKTHQQKSAIAEQILNSNGRISVDVNEIGTISEAQMAAVHIWFRKLSKAFNDAGITVYCPNEAMEQSMINGWQNVFPSDGLESKSKKKETWKMSNMELIDLAQKLNIGTGGKTRDQLIREIDGRA